MEQGKHRVTWRPVGGLDYSKESIHRSEGGVERATNFLFQKGVAHTRPLAFAGHLPGSVVPNGVRLNYFKYFEVGDLGTVLVDIFIGSDNKLYNSVPNGVEVTGTGTNFLPRRFHNAELINGAVVVANNVGGLLHWAYAGGTTYTVISDAPYLFVTSHISRAVAAFDISGGGVADAAECRTVAWSIAGDATDWTGEGSGVSVLSGIPSYIMGLQNIRNVLVIPHKTGFHLGYPTGIGTSAFRFESHTRVGTGLAQPSAICSHDNLLYFIGTDANVYRFDLSRADPIGDQVRPRLSRAIRNGVNFRMFLTKNAPTNGSHEPKHLLHLVPITLAEGSVTGHTRDEATHFILDLNEQKWSEHRYGVTTFRSGGSYVTGISGGATSGIPLERVVLGIHSEPELGANTLRWVSGAYNIADNPVQDAPSQLFLDERIVNDDPLNDYALHDLLVVWAREEEESELAFGAPYPEEEFEGTPPITIQVRYKENYRMQSKEVIVPTSDLTGDAYGWYRTMVNIRAVGQFFQPVVIVPYGIRIKIERVEGYFMPAYKTKAGQFAHA